MCIISFFVSFKQEASTQICNTQQSPQQLLYNLYNKIALTEIKGYTMMQFSWTLLKLYNIGENIDIPGIGILCIDRRHLYDDRLICIRQLHGGNGAAEATVRHQNIRDIEGRQDGYGLCSERGLEVRSQQA